MEFAEVTKSLLLIVVVGFLTLCSQKILKQLWYQYKLRNVKGPRALPVVGNILQFGKTNIDFFEALDGWCNEFREAGCYKLFFGFQPVVMVFNAYDMEKILCNTSLDVKGLFYQLVSPWLGDGLLMSKGTKWTKRRKLLTPSFHFSILIQFLPVFNDHAQTFKRNLLGLSDRGAIDIVPLVTSCSLDIICETIMGLELGSQKGQGEEYVGALLKLGDIFMERTQCPWYWNEALFRKMGRIGREYCKCLELLHKTTKNVIRKRKMENQKRDESDIIIDDASRDVRSRRRLAFLDLMIEVQKQDKEFTDEGIQEEVDTFMFEGHDTVSTSLAVSMYLIGKHPHVQRQIHDELDMVFGNDRERMVTNEDIQKLEYLSRVMKESQRMMATVPIFQRQLDRDVEACGTKLPNGTVLFLAAFWLHRDPKQFPNPDVFDPDRFLPANIEGRHKFAYVPFSAGHRNCIGQKFALMEQKVILATILREVELTATQDINDLRLCQEFILRSEGGIKIIVSPRK